ncbi:substrate-binding periplasmic protein [Planctobacterium marinum]|uniref:Solute-binding protein family 3/N-terminal domain-containing protein n=1 Tax=Planctobacterium marinum TaxID=1631968 RepID=A0AA48HXX8_9ALTE|nr:hypothetical protein MACH26_34390 [Planctobacterium marinum]
MNPGLTFTKKMLFLIFACGLSFATHSAPKQTIVYPVSIDLQDKRDLYTVAVVKVIFARSKRYQLQALPLRREYDKLLALLKRGELDIAWGGASATNIEQFRAVDFPIMRGLIGYRLFLVKKSNKDMLKNVAQLNDLKPYTIGQGSTWVEIDMFQRAGLQVVPAESYPALFSMLANGRFELFPRSILEISNELNTFSQYELEVADHVALHYDFALLFYVNKNNKQLHQYLTERLKDPVIKLQIEQLFNKYYRDSLDKYHYEHRRVIKLPNTLMPSVNDFEQSN